MQDFILKMSTDICGKMTDADVTLEDIYIGECGDPRKGSLNFRKDLNTPATVFNSDGEITAVFVPFFLEASINMKLVFTNNSNNVISIDFTLTEDPSAPIFGGFSVPIKMQLMPGKIGFYDITLNTANLKHFTSTVRKIESRWQWGDNATGAVFAMSPITVYTLPGMPCEPVWYSTPEPYSKNEYRYVWTDILDICCNACLTFEKENGHMVTTKKEMMEALVYELYSNLPFQYDIIAGACYYTIKDADLNGIVRLQLYVQDAQSSKYKAKLNCTDCASLVAIQALACGIPEARTIRISNGNHFFACNPIIAIGRNEWKSPFNGGFSYHEVAVIDNQNVCDACLALDEGGYPEKDDYAGKSPTIPCFMHFTDNSSQMVRRDSPYTKQEYRERLVRNGEMCWAEGLFSIRAIHPGLWLENNKVGTHLTESLMPLAEHYGLTENPLPVSGKYGKWKEDLLLTGHDGIDSSILLEDCGRNRIYQIQAGENSFRVELFFAENEQEAHISLLTKLAGVANPGVERINFGDIAFAVDERWLLFVKRNVIIQVSGDESCNKLAELILSRVDN